MIFKKLNVAVTIFFLNSFKTLREIFFSYFYARMKVSPCTQVIVMVLTLGLLCEVHAQNYHFSNGWQPGKRSYRGCTVRPEIRSILFKIIEVNTKSFFIIWTFAQNHPLELCNKTGLNIMPLNHVLEFTNYCSFLFVQELLKRLNIYITYIKFYQSNKSCIVKNYYLVCFAEKCSLTKTFT